MERPAKGEEVTLARSAGFALAQLLGVASLVSVMLTLTSGNPLRNLPAAAALVLALRVLARVRLDARWDADTRRLSVSLTRRDAPGEPSADVSGAVDAFPPASAPARATRISGDADARPPRTKLLGFIPWKRPSSAYGYPQALDGTWDWYRRETGHGGADRDDFGDAVHFVGWYHYQSHVRNGIARNDAYHLYLAYYAGHGGYARGTWKSRPYMKRSAQRAQDMATRYAVQMERCGR